MGCFELLVFVLINSGHSFLTDTFRVGSCSLSLRSQDSRGVGARHVQTPGDVSTSSKSWGQTQTCSGLLSGFSSINRIMLTPRACYVN